VRRPHLQNFIWLALLACVVFVGARASANTDAVAPAAHPPVNDFAGMIMSNGLPGRVGIGTRLPAATLDVYQGEVKIGSTGAACTEALAGAIRYTDTKLQLCDGAGWRNVRLDKAQ
jgi:hypothetical protein